MTFRRRDILALPPALLLACPAWAQPGERLAVEVSGEIPGVVVADAAPFIATQMGRAGLIWNFSPARPGPGKEPHRVDWRFESEKQHGRRTGAYAVSAQVRLYRFTQYEKTIFRQVSMKGGLLDPAFAPFIIAATHDLLDRVTPLSVR